MRHQLVIATLGGPRHLAAALGAHRTRVSHWQREGIPPRRFAEIVRLAGRLGRPEITLEALFRGRASMRRAAARKARAA
jgi:hypothetical protein